MSPLERADMALLMPTLRRTAALIAVLGCAYAVVIHFAERFGAERAIAEAELANAQARYDAVRESTRMVRTYQRRFDALKARGLIDTTPRLGWIEAVQRSASSLGLRTVSFDLAPTAPMRLEYPSISAATGGSPMTLQLALVHEGELLAFLQRLRAQAPALMWTRSCDLKRSATTGFAPGSDNLSARCEVLWLTMHTTAVPAPPEE